jgi:YHS domain-containing protein
MNPTESPMNPSTGMPGKTACGSSILVTSDTPYTYYRDEVVFFCGQDCKQIYDEDPMNSCMAARLFSGK